MTPAMAQPHQLSRQQARRIAVRAHLLAARQRGQGPEDMMGVLRHLTMLKYDPTAAVARSADLVLWSRLGRGYRPVELVDAVDRRDVVEFAMRLRPAEDMALYRAEMDGWPSALEERPWHEDLVAWVEANDSTRVDLLARIDAEGPLAAREIPDTCRVPWRSSGWTNHKSVQRLLDCLAARGEVAVARREGGDRLWDLADRVYPQVPAVPLTEAVAERSRRRLVALGIARETGPRDPEPEWVGDTGEPVVIEDVRGRWRVDPEQLALADVPVEPRAALLSPLDRIVYDRKRLGELWGYEYQLEMYKPASRRRWGYWALPVLYGEEFVGKLDAAADRATGLLVVRDLHQDTDFGPETIAAVSDEIRSLAAWLGLGLQLA